MDNREAHRTELSRDVRVRRVRAVLDAARRLADPHDPLGIEARRAARGATALSEPSIELSLSRHLETSATSGNLEKLVSWAGAARRVHVVLSANVFTGVVRAVALAVAAAPSVIVRPSSREGVLAPLLLRALIEQGRDTVFELSGALEPTAGDHVHVYGSRETIATIRARCPAEVTVRGHGPGFGVAIVSTRELGNGALRRDLAAHAQHLSWDIVAFDQRGCLSPRAAFVDGSPEDAERFASCLAAELERREVEVPRGTLTDEERRERTLYRQTLQVVGQYHEGPTSVVGIDVDPRAMTIPPTGRHLHVVRVTGEEQIAQLLGPYHGAITCIGTSDETLLTPRLARLAPGARILPLGEMQHPPLDGPVDLREML